MLLVIDKLIFVYETWKQQVFKLQVTSHTSDNQYKSFTPIV